MAVNCSVGDSSPHAPFRWQWENLTFAGVLKSHGCHRIALEGSGVCFADSCFVQFGDWRCLEEDIIKDVILDLMVIS